MLVTLAAAMIVDLNRPSSARAEKASRRSYCSGNQ